MEILIGWAKDKAPKTYSDLSDAYMVKTDEWHEKKGGHILEKKGGHILNIQY